MMRVKKTAVSILPSLVFLAPIALGQMTDQEYVKRGNAAFNKGLYDEAIANYSKTIQLDPRDAEAYYNRGLANKEKGEYDQAISDYDRALKINPTYALAQKNRELALKAKIEAKQKASVKSLIKP